MTPAALTPMSSSSCRRLVVVARVDKLMSSSPPMSSSRLTDVSDACPRVTSISFAQPYIYANSGRATVEPPNRWLPSSGSCHYSCRCRLRADVFGFARDLFICAGEKNVRSQLIWFMYAHKYKRLLCTATKAGFTL